MPTPNCANNRICGRFASSLWYADSMALKAKLGYAAYCRQDFIGADYGLVNYTSYLPSPDYWLLVLWKRLVGTRVLALEQPAAKSTRAYAFCAAPGLAPAGSAILVLLNLDSSEVCYGTPENAAPGAILELYTLTPGLGGVESASVNLNGVRLSLDASGRLPNLPGAPVAASEGILLPPLSVTLAVMPLQDAATCPS